MNQNIYVNIVLSLWRLRDSETSFNLPQGWPDLKSVFDLLLFPC